VGEAMHISSFYGLMQVTKHLLVFEYNLDVIITKNNKPLGLA